MGVFAAVFGRRGAAGFSGPLLRASSGVVGFNLTMFVHPVREICRPARLHQRPGGTKLAQHAQNAPKRAISSEQGEFCTANPARRGLQGEFYTAVARRGSCWASLVSSRHRPCHEFPAFRRPPHRGAARPGNLRRSRQPHSTFRTGGDGGFAALGGGWRRVAGVSTPRVVQFPRLVAVTPRLEAVGPPKRRPIG